jgi:hypothetical protein
VPTISVISTKWPDNYGEFARIKSRVVPILVHLRPSVVEKVFAYLVTIIRASGSSHWGIHLVAGLGSQFRG